MSRSEATTPEIRLAVAEPDLDVGHVETVLEGLIAPVTLFIGSPRTTRGLLAQSAFPASTRRGRTNIAAQPGAPTRPIAAATDYRPIGLAPGDLPVVTARTPVVNSYDFDLKEQ